MNIKVHSVGIEAGDYLNNFVTERVDKLELFYDRIVGSEVFLRIDGASKTDDKVAEIKMMIPGKELFAKKQGKSFEEAIDLAIEALKRQLQKQKEKAQPKKSVPFML